MAPETGERIMNSMGAFFAATAAIGAVFMIREFVFDKKLKKKDRMEISL